jgi:hypothetical protein
VALRPLQRKVFAVHRADGRSPTVGAMLDVLAETVAARGVTLAAVG